MKAAEALSPDPFSCVADPSRYVPRAATEEAREALRRALAAGPGRPVAFTGPTGIGKSMLLQVLAGDLASDYTIVCLQATPRDAEEICECALDALGDAVARDPAGALALRAAELSRRGRPLVLALDSAEGLTHAELAELAALLDGTLRLIVVASERDGLDEDLAALGPSLQRVRLAASLSRAEAEDYLRARLEAADAPPELRVRLLGAVLDLWRRSRGNPQALHAEISQVQLELWRSSGSEPRLRLVPVSPAPETLAPPPPAPAQTEPPAAALPEAEPEPAGPIVELDGETAPVPEIAEAPSVAPLAPPVPVVASEAPIAPAHLLPSPPPRARERGRLLPFALGVLAGGVAASAAWLWLGSAPLLQGGVFGRTAQPAAASAVPARDPELLPPVSAAPETPREAPAGEQAPAPVEAAPPSEIPQPVPPAAPRPEAAARPVRIHVQALPWATIYVDDRLVGETPLGDLPVVPGVREFRALMSDGRELVKRVEVRAGARVVFQ